MEEKIKRYVVFIVGLFVNSLGVSLITKASLGTSPISSIPYVLSLKFPFTLGTFTVFFSLLLIFLQLMILGKNFKPEHILQIPVSFVFGYFIDLCMELLFFIHPTVYWQQFVYLLIGCLVLGIGVYMEMLADVVMLPGESFVRSIVFRWKTEFGTTKVIFDVSMTLIAALLSFIFAGRLDGVREGTVVAAILVGFIARLIARKFPFIPTLLFGSSSSQAATPLKSNFCITIDRQYGSGGHDLGELLAKKLNFDFYDRSMIQMAAGSTGYSPEFIARREERITNSLLYDLSTQMYAYSQKSAPNDTIFEAESKIVLDAADRNSCIFVGHCADYVLRDRTNCLRIFLSAPIPQRVQRIMKTENLSEKEALKKIQQMDRERAEYYHYYTHRFWGKAANYHLCIDTSIGAEQIEKIILQCVPDSTKACS